MKQYIDIVKHVLENGKEKKPTRKNQQTGKHEPVDGGVSTITCPNVHFSHDMEDGFPLLTTKKMAWRSCRVELEGFIKGITDKSWYQQRGCKIWDQWANPEMVERMKEDLEEAHPTNEEYPKKKVQEMANDLGPIYGYQWRNFGKQYGEPECYNEDGYPLYYGQNGLVEGSTDQLMNIVNSLRDNPHDRRMVCMAWNPNQEHLMALPPCHLGFVVNVTDNKLNLHWTQRSCDLMLGIPFNIASYGLLLLLLAEVGGFEAGNLSGMFVDCHIYTNQVESAKEQIKREPKTLPEVVIKRKPLGPRDFNIFDWNCGELDTYDYNPHPKLSFGNVVV